MSEPVTTVTHSPSIALLALALAKAQGGMKNPAKDSANPHFKSKYADLANVRDAVVPALSANKLALTQIPTEATIGDVTGPALLTMLIHESGEFIQTISWLRAQKNDPQGVGSAMTYIRRYAMQSMAGVAAEDDDDGNAASRTSGNNANGGQQPQLADHDDGPYREAASMLDKVTDRPTLDTAMSHIKANAGQYGSAELAQLRTRCGSLTKKYPAPAAPAATTDTKANDDIAA